MYATLNPVHLLLKMLSSPSLWKLIANSFDGNLLAVTKIAFHADGVLCYMIRKNMDVFRFPKAFPNMSVKLGLTGLGLGLA